MFESTNKVNEMKKQELIHNIKEMKKIHINFNGNRFLNKPTK